MLLGIAAALHQLSLTPRFQPAAPLPSVSAVMIDSYQNGIGLAQQIARNRQLQARIIWIDATANIDRYNTEDKIVALVHQISDTGFNTIVFDIKPISGQVVYPSRIAPKLTEWKGKTLPAEFDPLAVFVREAKADGVSVLVSLNAFSEGHRIFHVGPGYEKINQQTVLYESTPVLRMGGQSFPVAAKLNTILADSISVLSSQGSLPPPGGDAFVATVRPNGKVVDGYDFSLPQASATIPTGGVALYATGQGAAFLRAHVQPGQNLSFDSESQFVPISQRPEQQIPLMMNPADPLVRQYARDVVKEVVENYAVDGVIYDDRLRFGGINADFSETTRRQFEAAVQNPITWPDDVFRWTYTQKLTRGIRPGKYYDQWMAWRASRIRDYVAEIRQTVSQTRPGTLFGAYVGSWYGEYPQLGHNYASPDARAGFWFLSPNYSKMGTAPLLDFLVTGCYYKTATIYDAMEQGVGIGSTVEAAGTLVNRLAGDQCWTYAGLSLSDFKDDPDALLKCMQAACASTQGVMIFDLSHDIEPMWPVFAQAFHQKARPPHASPTVLADVRRRRKALSQTGYREPPIIIAAGSSGVGQ
jgi:uncharacterized lipoprotein YddW (UPF0748 family)